MTIQPGREERVSVARVDAHKSGKSANGGSCLPDFSKVSFRNEAYLDRIPSASVKLSSTGRTI